MTRTERQLQILRNWVKNKCKGTAVCCTGFGKTTMALKAIEVASEKNPGLETVVVVPTNVLKEQWYKNIEEKEITSNVKVITINNAASAAFDCDFLIIDEAHRANASSFRKLFDNCDPHFILGLTATYERLDSKEKEVMDKYCPVCDTVTIQEAVKNKWLAPYKEYKVLLDVDLTAYDKANKEFIQHFAFFNFDFTLGMSIATNFWAQQQYAKEINCTVAEVKAHAYSWLRALKFRKAFVANHPHKLEVAKKIIEARKDKKIITFNSSIKQCEAYKSGYIVHSGKTKKKNSLSIEEFSHVVGGGVIHSAAMLKEGLDVPGLSVAIITGFNSSKTEKVQEIGRTIRFEPGKQAEIFVLVIKGSVEEKWYDKASEYSSYIEISEQELDKILNNEDLENEREIYQEESIDALLRY